MPDVFLSYSREDQAIARRFADAFERAGLSVWWDQSLSPGETFDEVTEKALEQARAVVVLWSKNSIVSRWVRAEASQADDNGTLVPVLIEPCNLPIKFRLTQTADLTGWSGEPQDPRWQSLVAGIRRFVESSVPAGSDAPAPRPSPARHLPRRRWLAPAIIGGAAVLLIVAGGLWMLEDRSSRVAGTSQASSGPPVAQPEAGPSIAVLPFVNMSSDPEQEYFSDGLSEELLNQLASVPDLRVIGRTSSFAFKGQDEPLSRIGELLGVNHILAGSVRKAGNRVRVIAQLINPADGTQLWSETYEHTLENIFQIQEEIARKVAGELQLRMNPAAGGATGTRNVAAYDEFLAGRSLLASLSPDSMLAAVPHLERAVALDPNFVAAWLWLIDACTRSILSGVPDPQAMLARQSRAIERVVALAPGSAEASFAESYRVALGTDLVQLERLLKDSLRLTGSQGVRARLRYGQFLLAAGHPEQAIVELERVKRDDPLDIFVRINLLLTLEFTAEVERAQSEQRQLASLPGGNSPMLVGTALTRAMAQRDVDQVREVLAGAVAGNGVATANTDSTNARMLQLLDNPPAAIQELKRELQGATRANDIVEYSTFAVWAAWFGDRDLALQLLDDLRRRSFSFETWAFTLWRPVMSDLRGDARFTRIVRETGLERYWRTTGNWGNYCRPTGAQDFECR